MIPYNQAICLTFRLMQSIAFQDNRLCMRRCSWQMNVIYHFIHLRILISLYTEIIFNLNHVIHL
ncbi:putative membrane protein [Bacillus glycinifermentans]|nr:putative membrane protein [Bacillus glycinifermentans]